MGAEAEQIEGQIAVLRRRLAKVRADERRRAPRPTRQELRAMLSRAATHVTVEAERDSSAHWGKRGHELQLRMNLGDWQLLWVLEGYPADSFDARWSLRLTLLDPNRRPAWRSGRVDCTAVVYEGDYVMNGHDAQSVAQAMREIAARAISAA
jgi:hypothetical protein